MNFCLPRLYIIPLFLARFIYPKTKIVAYYGEWPLYLLLVSRFASLDARAVEAFIGRLTGVEVRKIPLVYESTRDYGYSAKDVELTTRITEKLVPQFDADPWVSLLKKFAGDEPAMAYALKYASHFEIYLQLSYAISLSYTHPQIDPVIAWKPSWPEEWLKILNDSIPARKLSFFRWPKWYVKLHSLCYRLILPFRILGISLARIAARRVASRRTTKKHFELMAEFIEPARLGGSPFDADFLIDETGLPKTAVLFFLTSTQRKILQSENQPLTDVLNKVRSRGYELVSLEQVPYSPKILTSVIKGAFDAIRMIATAQTVALANVYVSAWKQFLEYAGLFHRYSARNFLHLTHPPGNTGWRLEGPMITSLCRQNGIRAVGCQSTLLHFKLHEFSFECSDLFLSWGTAWTPVLGEGMKFAKTEQVVGCQFLDAYILEYQKQRALQAPTERRRVLIFTGDIASAHYPFCRTLSFLEACCRLALANPNFEFLIKTKNAEDPDRVLSDTEFSKLFSQSRGNCRFVSAPRHEYVQYLASAALVIAMGFTTPGSEALLLGIPTIYYDGFRFAGAPFRSLPGLIVADAEEMQRKFAVWVSNPDSLPDKGWDLNRLDPYRDGHAKRRINTILARELV
jgi:hypothetical protein